MANTAQAKKRVRQNNKKRLHNAAMRSAMRTSVKKIRSSIELRDLDLTNKQLPEVFSILDNYARKGLLSKNKASRLKSRISIKAKTLTA